MKLTFVSLAALGAMAACQGTTATPVAPEELCAALAQIACTADQACCEPPPGTVPTFDAGPPADAGAPDAMPEPGCEAVQRAACQTSLEPLLDDPRTGYDPARGGAWLERMRAAGTACWTPAPTFAEVLDLFAGTGEAGADCTPATLDEPSLRLAALSCRRPLACRLRLRADGQPIGTCEARDDDACSHRADCTPDRFCDLPSPWEPGLWGECRPLRADGWACGDDTECASHSCLPDGICGAADAPACLTRPYENEVLDDRPLAYWRLAAGGGTTLDETGGGLDGVAAGGVSAASGALVADGDGATRFDGATGNVTMGPSARLELGPVFTVELWLLPEGAAAARTVAAFGGGDVPGLRVGLVEAGDQVVVDFADRQVTARAVTGTLAAGRFTHVAATCDGSVGRLYIDGSLAAEIGDTRAPTTGGDLRLAAPAGTTAAFAGVLDEVAVYDRALTAGRLSAHRRVATQGPATRDWIVFRWFR